MSITSQEVRCLEPDFLRSIKILLPINCPIKKTVMENNIELNSIPIPKNHLNQIIKRTGKWMAINH